ncbi:4Fe-4S ferredoxin, iron-sulfur binding protein [Richelia sinica FACHB-800]|uniref:4Fe-4S ferredoxin, iron-sulfur binding protein n=1 Tax=Richelia sinica FACHB-800 TaxID=1357546 RepID=A0A975T7X3_9NOST|nr:LdpA C-terminal domain-containing domain [Richelia sinica]MBD2665252.1 4Fe-4S binding protein [Richelia sinica FACHB-800]QXE23679.1 4Fe-4S ferredoxin, iron-sulfur binding protein [Richelia sinica FACHB-800]
MTNLLAPLQSLKQGHWFKLICGASFQDLPAVRSLTLAYTLAGADCIDVAADPAVIASAQSALLAAKKLAREAQERGFNFQGDLPLLMVSLNDGEDPHFRKAEFNSTLCPPDCHRPCEKICPAQAIVFNSIKNDYSGVVSQKCYGCGRCVPICPYDIIYTSSYVSTPGAIAPLIMSTGVDAIEIHTQVGRLAEFKRLWQALVTPTEGITPWTKQLKLVAVSCPDGEGLIDYLQAIYEIIAPHVQMIIWQTDGRSMSGDIGDGTTIAAIKLGQKVLAANLPGYVQLAGGTNSYTIKKLKTMGLLKDLGLPTVDWELDDDNSKSPIPNSPSQISGVAYGSYARVLLSPILEQLEPKEVISTGVQTSICLEDNPQLLWQAVGLAHSLVSQIKSQR